MTLAAGTSRTARFTIMLTAIRTTTGALTVSLGLALSVGLPWAVAAAGLALIRATTSATAATPIGQRSRISGCCFFDLAGLPDANL